MRWLLVILVVAAAGCTFDRYAQLETATPSLSEAQLAELRRRTQSPEALGVEVVRQGNMVGLRGVNELVATGTVTAALLPVMTDKPYEPGGRFRAPVVLARVNERGEVRLMLDSGSNQSLCGYTLAQRLKLPVMAGMEPATGGGIGGTVDHVPGLVESLKIGGVELRRLVTMISPDVQVLRVQQLFGSAPVWLLGVNALRGLSYLTVDNLRGTVTFGVGEPYRPDASSSFVTHVPLSWRNNLPCVPMSVDDHGPFPCVVDTGGDYGLLISRNQATALKYWQMGKGNATPTRGVAGAGLTATYAVKRATLGGATLTQVPGRTIVVGPEPGFAEMLVGNVVLRRYRVTFDFKGQQFWLELPGR